jgi:hypothetical protein
MQRSALDDTPPHWRNPGQQLVSGGEPNALSTHRVLKTLHPSADRGPIDVTQNPPRLGPR